MGTPESDEPDSTQEQSVADGIAGQSGASWDEGVATVFWRLTAPFVRIASGILGLAVFGYIMGWFRAREYYAAFGVPWIAEHLHASALLSGSAYPLGLLAFFTVLMLADLAKTLPNLRLHSQIHAVSIYAAPGFATAAIATSAFLQLPIIARLLSHLALMFWAVLAANVIGWLLIGLHASDFRWSIRLVRATFFIFFVGLYMIPTQLGRADGQLDRTPKFTSLTRVRSPQLDGEDWLLLASTPSLSYAVQLREGGKPRKVAVVETSGIAVLLAPVSSSTRSHSGTEESSDAGDSSSVADTLKPR